EIGAIDRGDDDMVEAELLDRDRHPPRLEDIERIGPAGRDVAEGAAPGADLAHDHHGRVTLGPALADIGAARLLADGDEAVRAHDLTRLVVALAGRRLHPDPSGLAQDRRVRLVRLLRMTLGAVAQISFLHGYLEDAGPRSFCRARGAGARHGLRYQCRRRYGSRDAFGRQFRAFSIQRPPSCAQ